MARWKGTTTQRGYGGPHQKLRAKWEPLVDEGRVLCHAVICLHPARLIKPGEPWHLGHTPDRTAWTGPEHAKCNEADGARRGNRRRGNRKRTPTILVTSRRW